MAVKFSNNAFATLGSSLTNVATTLSLSAGQGARFPSLGAGDYFFATLVDPSNNIEIIKVTARATDTLTIVRGQDGTSPRSFSGGDRIELRVVAAALDALQDFSPVGSLSATTVVEAITELDTEKAPINSPAFTGTPTAPTASPGTNTTQLATTAFVRAALEAVYPVGSVYTNAVNSANPATLLGFGTWVAFAAGRVPVGVDPSNPLFDTPEETGGSADAIVVSHTHTYSGTTSNKSLTGRIYVGGSNQSPSGIVSYGGDTGARPGLDANSGTQVYYDINASHDHTFSGTTASAGSSGTNANLQPYITVYMWKRTA